MGDGEKVKLNEIKANTYMIEDNNNNHKSFLQE